MKQLEKLAQRLKELRKHHHLTQEEFSAVAGISYKFYQQLESGKKKQIWLSTIEKLAETYRLQTWELLMPDFPKHAKVKKALKSSIHYRRNQR